MMRLLRKGTLALMALGFAAAAQAAVVRPAPNVALQGSTQTLRSFKGQTVVLLIAKDARQKNFRTLVYRLRRLYGQFATERVVFIAALEYGPQEVKSDIPFAIAANPAQVAQDYGVNGPFGIVVVGVDGNLDMVTQRMIAPEKVHDMIFNNYEIQNAGRKSI
jgi:hypothetical protein